MSLPSILLITADQHNAQVAGCYGNDVVSTPNLDALAARGTVFENAYSPSPICVPARAALATGRYPHEIGAWDNGSPYTGIEARSWGHRLSDAGWDVVTVGKLHYRGSVDPTGFPDQRLPMHIRDGIGNLAGLLRGEMPPLDTARKGVLGARVGSSSYIRYDTAIADHAINWLRTRGSSRRPWAMHVSFVCPHPPLICPEEFLEMYRGREDLPLPSTWLEDNWLEHPVYADYRRLQKLERALDRETVFFAVAAYYGLVSFVDEQIGRVIGALEESSLLGDTLVIYTSDHGEMLGDQGLWGKCTMRESSVAVPLIVAGIDVPAGHRSVSNASLVDVYPTILQAAGIDAVKGDGVLPGRSLFDLATEESVRDVFSEFHATYSANASYMLRHGSFKYIYHVGAPAELFNLAVDPCETRNLALDPSHETHLLNCHSRLLDIVDPIKEDARAKRDQRIRVERFGGAEEVLRAAAGFVATPAPGEFD